MSRERWQRWGLFALAAAIVAVVLFPVYWMFVTSVLPSSLVLSRSPPLLPPPDAMSFAAYAEVFRRRPVFTWLLNSTIVVVGSVTISLFISTLAGYSLSRFRSPAQRVAGGALLLSKMLPGSLIVIPFFVMFTTVHLIDSLFGLMLANVAVGVPFATWMMKGFFESVPNDLEDAARIDGASRLGAMVRVVLPLVLGGLVATAVFIAIGAWNEFLFALMLTTSTGSRTWPVGLQLMVGEFQLPWGSLAAGGIISIVPVMVLFALVQRALVRGLTAGAVKG